MSPVRRTSSAQRCCESLLSLFEILSLSDRLTKLLIGLNGAPPVSFRSLGAGLPRLKRPRSVPKLVRDRSVTTLITSPKVKKGAKEVVADIKKGGDSGDLGVLEDILIIRDGLRAGVEVSKGRDPVRPIEGPELPSAEEVITMLLREQELEPRPFRRSPVPLAVPSTVPLSPVNRKESALEIAREIACVASARPLIAVSKGITGLPLLPGPLKMVVVASYVMLAACGVDLLDLED